MGLDVKTLYLINVAVLFMSAVAAGYFWRQYRENAWLLLWSVATGVSGVGLLVIGLFGPVPSLAVGAPAVVLLVAGYAIVWESMRRFNGRPPAIRRVAEFVLGFAVLYGSAVAVGADFTQRASLASAAVAICATLSAWEVMRGGNKEQLRSRFAMGATFVAMASVLVARAILPWLESSSPTAQTYYDPLQGIVPLVNSIAVVCLSIGLIMMANERTSGQHRKLALTDELTGLPNRRFFLEHAERLGRRAQRDGVPACIVMMDLDNFSLVNQRFGHAGGDEALVAFADLLRNQMRTTDIVARYGGEEFCAVLIGADMARGAQIAESIRARVAVRAIDVRGQSHRITVSIGVASLQGGAVSAALQKADEALYQAKSLGRNRIVARNDELLPAAAD